MKFNTINLFILGLAIFFFSCNEKSQDVFSLTGKTAKLDNGVMLYLDYDNEIIDSARVENNTFAFNAELPASPIKVRLYTADFSRVRRFWLENRAMTFDATAVDFNEAKITGSPTEIESEAFYETTTSLSRMDRRAKEIVYVDENPNSIISAHILSVYRTTWGGARTKELFNKFSTENKKSVYGQRIAKFVALNKDPEVGDQFADFEMADQLGNLKKLSDIKGKTILLEFWASWCAPCRQENPNLIKAYDQYSSVGFEIFAVSLDNDKEKWTKAIAEDKLPWKHVSDLKGNGNEAALIYGVSGIPQNFLIAENGTIIARNLRGEELNKKLAEIME